MARRQSELASLKVGECIDENSSSLIFKQSKSTKGIFGTRNTLYLPIDKLGIEMINNLDIYEKMFTLILDYPYNISFESRGNINNIDKKLQKHIKSTFGQ